MRPDGFWVESGLALDGPTTSSKLDGESIATFGIEPTEILEHIAEYLANYAKAGTSRG